MRHLGPGIMVDISRHRRYQHLISRAANMRLLSRALAFAVLVAGAILPNASHAQVVPAIKGGGSQINVYGLYTLVKTDFNSTLDYPPGAPPPSNTLDANGWNQAVWGGLCLASRRWGRASPIAPAPSENKEPSCSAPNFTTFTGDFALMATS
jgi:hypothetical protein